MGHLVAGVKMNVNAVKEGKRHRLETHWLREKLTDAKIDARAFSHAQARERAKQRVRGRSATFGGAAIAFGVKISKREGRG